jgi:hypothetical protein
MPNDTAFLDEMSSFLRKVRAHAPSVDGEILSGEFGFALNVGFDAAQVADSATEAARLAMSATSNQDEDVRGAAAMAAFIGYAYSSDEDPCPRVGD